MRVQTNLDATTINVAIINSVFGQMSDGIWENSSRMERVWRGLSATAEDGKITLVAERPSELSYKTPDEIVSYIAQKIKQIVKIEIDDGLKAEWDRSSTAVSQYLSRAYQPVEIRDAYQAYDILKNRQIKNRVPEQIDVHNLKVGMNIEGYGKIIFLQKIDIEGKEYFVIKPVHGSPKVISSEAILRRIVA